MAKQRLMTCTTCGSVVNEHLHLLLRVIQLCRYKVNIYSDRMAKYGCNLAVLLLKVIMACGTCS